MEDGVRLHVILHLLSPVYSTPNVWFKAKLSNKYTVGSKITKRNFPGGYFLSFLKWLCIVLPSFLSSGTLYMALCRIYIRKHPVHSPLSLSEHAPRVIWTTRRKWCNHGAGKWKQEAQQDTEIVRPLKEGQAESKGTQQLTLSLLERLMS